MIGGQTPFELELRRDLDGEFRRIANEWFFQWHNLSIENRTVDVEDFYGGRIRVGGIRFEGQIQEIYWRSVQRYLVDKVHATFKRWDETTAVYSGEVRRASLEGVGSLLWAFVARVIEYGVDTDRRLRGRGFPSNVEPYNASGVHSSANAEIERLKAAHLALLPGPKPLSRDIAPTRPKLPHRAEAFFSSWMGTLTAGGLVLALIAIAVSIILA